MIGYGWACCCSIKCPVAEVPVVSCWICYCTVGIGAGAVEGEYVCGILCCCEAGGGGVVCDCYYGAGGYGDVAIVQRAIGVGVVRYCFSMRPVTFGARLWATVS